MVEFYIIGIFLFQSSKGYLSYLDVSIGKEVSGICTKQGRLDVMGLNPQSAVVYLGHPNGKRNHNTLCLGMSWRARITFSELKVLKSLNILVPSEGMFNDFTDSKLVYSLSSDQLELCILAHA